MNMFQKANGKDFAEQCAGVWWLANVNLTGKVREGTGTDKKKGNIDKTSANFFCKNIDAWTVMKLYFL